MLRKPKLKGCENDNDCALNLFDFVVDRTEHSLYIYEPKTGIQMIKKLSKIDADKASKYEPFHISRWFQTDKNSYREMIAPLMVLEK